MKLVELEFDLPYQENSDYINNLISCNIDYKQALQKDYRDNWMWKRREFQLMTRCMCSMIERLMTPIINDKYWKILIECIGTDKSEFITSFKNLDGIFVYSTGFDYEDFIKKSSHEKKVFTVDFLLANIAKISQYTCLDLCNISEACFSVIKQNYKNSWIYRQKFNKKRNKLAKVLVDHDVDMVSIIVEISDNSSVLKQICLYQTLPDERMYSKFLGDIRWIDNQTLLFVSKQEKKTIKL